MKAWPCLQGASFSDGTEQAETSGERQGEKGGWERFDRKGTISCSIPVTECVGGRGELRTLGSVL